MDWAALLELLNNLEAASGVEEDEVLLYLQQFKNGFVKLLDFPVSVIRAPPAPPAWRTLSRALVVGGRLALPHRVRNQCVLVTL